MSSGFSIKNTAEEITTNNLQGILVSDMTPNDDDHLVYDSTTSEWTPMAVSGGSMGPTGPTGPMGPTGPAGSSSLVSVFDSWDAGGGGIPAYYTTSTAELSDFDFVATFRDLGTFVLVTGYIEVTGNNPLPSNSFTDTIQVESGFFTNFSIAPPAMGTARGTLVGVPPYQTGVTTVGYGDVSSLSNNTLYFQLTGNTQSNTEADTFHFSFTYTKL